MYLEIILPIEELDIKNRRKYYSYRDTTDEIIYKESGLYIHFKIDQFNIDKYNNEVKEKTYKCYLTMHKINKYDDPNKIHVTIENYLSYKSDFRLHFGINMISVIYNGTQTEQISSFKYLEKRTQKINDSLKDELITVIKETLNYKMKDDLNAYISYIK